MASSFAFSPSGPTILVQATAVQIAPSNAGTNLSYRVRNLSSNAQYFTHGASSSITSQGAPSSSTSSTNTIGMAGNATETFGNLLPFMIASSATGFEVTPGDGV